MAVVFLCLLMPLLQACSGHKAEDAQAAKQQHIEQELTRLNADFKSAAQAQAETDTILKQRLDRIEQELQRQQAQIDAISEALEAIRHRRVVSHKPSHKPASRPQPKPAGPARLISETPAPTADKQNHEAEKNSYTAAYLALKSGRYDEASQAFAELLKTWPQGEYADQAWYWLGESQLAQKQAEKAIASFSHVIKDFPDSIKHAAALLKLGQIHQMQGHTEKARHMFNRLIDEHPDSTAAEQARSALAAMENGSKK